MFFKEQWIFNYERKEDKKDFKSSIMKLEVLEEKFDYKSPYKQIVELDKSKIPKYLHILIPYVQYFVSVNQIEREYFMKNAPLSCLEFLETLVNEYSNEIDDWLGGEESTNSTYSKEYLYFSIMSIMSMEYLAFRD